MILETADDILALIAGDPWRMDVLRTARRLELPDWWIGAGFVRAAVWDALHGYTRATPLDDVDLLYFDQGDIDETVEKKHEARLRELAPNVPWSVKNQARMHLRNNNPPYACTEEAMTYWLETPTAVAVRLGADDRLHLIAPFGVDDLLALRIRPTPAGIQRAEQFLDRVHGKPWLQQWPNARLVDAPSRPQSIATLRQP